RRYVESLSAYARQFLGQMDKPDVDYIEGLSPAISIDQKTTSRNPRSTVGTVTEIYDYYRLLYARIGIPHCPQCGKEITQQSVDQMADRIIGIGEGKRIQILAPVIRGRKGEHVKILEGIKKNGFVRARIDGKVRELSDEIKLEKNVKHTIEVIVDRIIIRENIRRRLVDSLETALKMGEGFVIVDVIGSKEMFFSEKFACPDCGISIEDLAPRMFSFNSPFGKCPKCDGLGTLMEMDPDLIIPDKNKSIDGGAIDVWKTFREDTWTYNVVQALAKRYDFRLDVPVKDLPQGIIDILLYGTNGEKVKVSYDREYGRGDVMFPFEGVVNNLKRRYRETSSEFIRSEIEGYMSIRQCPECKGKRLKKESRAVTVGGISICSLVDMSVKDELNFINSLVLTEREKIISKQIIKEIKARLQF
ncbi:MAG TPA: excinuclease ABC subunit UvrA, partial [Clostridiaceae bacterium]|nr:excinuclease ABC subunit UvrA [Clostridiaceae bacterium]